MKRVFTFTLSLLSFIAFSQQISPDVISSGGGNFENEELSLSWTIGETVITTLESDYILTQGFHQDFFIITAVDEQEMENISINIFPNPTQDYLNIEWKSNNNSIEIISVQLLDANGRILTERTFNSSSDIMKINLQSFERAHYILRLINGKQIKTFKVIKT